MTVGPSPETTRFVLVESPMDHEEFKSLYRRLGKIGIMVPMVEMINCALNGRDVLDTRAGRSWTNRTTDQQQRMFRPNIAAINRKMQTSFRGMLRQACTDCRVIEYCDGVMVIEVRRVVDWNQLNSFTSPVRGGVQYAR